MNRNRIFEFWERGQSGEVFAMQLDYNGVVTGCYGPLVSNQIRSSALPNYPYFDDPGYLAWIETHRENWAPTDLQLPPHY